MRNWVTGSFYGCVLFSLVYFFYLVRLLREELQLLQEQGSYVGEVVRAMDKKKVLVKVKNMTPKTSSLRSHPLCIALARVTEGSCVIPCWG